MYKKFRKARKALDSYSPQESYAAVKKRMSECQLRLETAHHEAEKVVEQDHQAWGYRTRESRRRKRQTEDERALLVAGLRGSAPPIMPYQQVRFENRLLDEKQTVTVDVQVEGRPSLMTKKNAGATTSTTASPNLDQ
jgi:hypothetical protein